MKFGIPEQPLPEIGDILIAEPFMRDDNLRRTVVYLCDISEEGAYGMVLNHPLPVPLKMMIENFPADGFFANYGGPVHDDKLYFVHNDSTLEGAEFVHGKQYFGGSFEQLMQKIDQGEISKKNVRFFAGYTGWDAGQLEQEIQERSWIVWKKHRYNMFNTVDTELWNKFMKEMGGVYKSMERFPLFFEHN